MKELCQKYLQAKAAEQAAKDARLEAEAALLEMFHPSKDEGTETKATEGFKISVTSKLTRQLDIDAYNAMSLPDNMTFVDFKPAINLKNLRMMERLDPAIVAQCITVKPAKPSIKVEEVA